MINYVTGIVRHIGIADNFQKLVRSIDISRFLIVNWARFGQVCCPCKVDIVGTKFTLFVQNGRCSFKLDVVCTKCEHHSYKVLVVLPKLDVVIAKCGRCLHKIDVVVCTKSWTKKKRYWQVNFDIKPLHGSQLFFNLARSTPMSE